jgi:RNA polymerase sigma factor (TIGR02999 family)
MKSLADFRNSKPPVTHEVPRSDQQRENHALEEEGAGSQPELLATIYGELRAMAEAFLRGERDGHTLQATALVHEAYLRLASHHEVKCNDRAHFFALAAQVMRRILVDHARAKKRLKRGGGSPRTILLTDAAPGEASPELDLVALEDSMNRLAAETPLSARIVEMRFFAGLTEVEIAHLLDISERTVRRHWTHARAWLFRDLARSEGDSRGSPRP